MGVVDFIFNFNTRAPYPAFCFEIHICTQWFTGYLKTKFGPIEIRQSFNQALQLSTWIAAFTEKFGHFGTSFETSSDLCIPCSQIITHRVDIEAPTAAFSLGTDKKGLGEWQPVSFSLPWLIRSHGLLEYELRDHRCGGDYSMPIIRGQGPVSEKRETVRVDNMHLSSWVFTWH